jgi:hypothetical protein
MKIPRVQSAPAIMMRRVVREGVSQFRKSGSSQVLSELVQLSAEDMKHVNTIFSDFGPNMNEFAQSGVDCVEEELDKPTKVLVKFAVRFVIGNAVHLIHHMLLLFYDFIVTHIHIFLYVTPPS